MDARPEAAPRLLVGLIGEAPVAGDLIGIEHEYRVLDGTGRQLDFRELLHTLAVDGQRLDPGDLNAYRLASGLALTADEAEAEVATPPVAIAAGFAPRVAALSAEGRGALAAVLPAGLTLEGYSTHISVSVAEGEVDAVAARYARVYAPAFAALAERPGSLGIYVRPRSGRLELCADYIEPERLPPVLGFAAGTVRACVDEVRTGAEFLGALAVDVRPARERPGHRVHRQIAFGFDVYRVGRRAGLPLAGGGTTTLGERLAAGARLAEAHLGDDLDATTAGRLRAIVEGAALLGIEGGERVAETGLPAANGWRPAPRTFRRAGFEVAPVVATWDFTVFRIQGARHAYASVPLARLEAFERELGAGRLDDEIGRFLAEESAGRVLETPEEARRPALYDELTSDPRVLLAQEPGAKATPRGAPGRFGKPARPGKAVSAPPFEAPLRIEPTPPSTSTPADRPTAPPPSRTSPAPTLPTVEGRPPSKAWRPIAIAAAAVLAVVIAVSAIAVAVTGGKDGAAGGAVATATSAAEATSTPTSKAVETGAPGTPVATATTSSGGGSTATPAGSSTPGASATGTAGAVDPVATKTATSQPPSVTATPRPTDTPAATPGATSVPTAATTPAVTPSPSPTATPTPTVTAAPTPGVRNVTCTSVDRNVASTCQLVMGDTGPEATSITWQAADATPSSGTGATFHPVYTTAGDHLVTVTVCAGTACATRTVTVHVL